MIDGINEPNRHASIAKHSLVGMKGLQLRFRGPCTAVPWQAVLGTSRSLHWLVDLLKRKDIQNKLSLLFGFFESQFRLGREQGLSIGRVDSSLRWR
jgi:hypothetical protein